MVDFDKLKDQEPNSFSAMDYSNIMNLFDYNPWNVFVDGRKQENPDMDRVTSHILNLKKPDENYGRNLAVDFFSKALIKQLLPIKPEGNLSICIVPSHAEKKLSRGLMVIRRKIMSDFQFENKKNLLFRSETIDKLAGGGKRDKATHRSSIKINNAQPFEGKTVYLFDDVSSTGNSINVCKELLLEGGAKRVAMIVLAQTVKN